MTFLAPLALGFLALVGVIVALYILRADNLRYRVSSVRFWRDVTSDLEGRPRWRLPTTTLLLILQLLIAGLAALALARPGLAGATKQHLIVLVDTSPGMLATDVAPTRFAAAIGDAKREIAGLKIQDDVTLIRVDANPAVIATGHPSPELTRAIDGLSVEPGQSDFKTAVALADQTARQIHDARAQILVLTDGAFAPDALAGLQSAPADTSVHLFNGGANNQGITRLDVRPSASSVARFVALTQISNFLRQPVTIPVRTFADGIQIDQRQLKLPAEGHVDLALPLPQGSRLVTVAVDAKDAYRLDDTASAIVNADRRVNVTLVSDNPSTWEKVLKSIPYVHLTSVKTADFKAGPADLVIFDGFLPPQLPTTSLLIVNPPQGNSAVPVQSIVQNQQILRTEAGNPIFDSVDLTGLVIPKATKLAGAGSRRPIAESTDLGLIQEGELNGSRVIVFAFDPGQTELPGRLAFPILVANMIDQLAPDATPRAIQPGTAVDLQAAAGTEQVQIQLPNNQTERFDYHGTPVRFTDTLLPGIYSVRDIAKSKTIAQQSIIVNAIDAQESSIGAQIQPDQYTRTGVVQGVPIHSEIWPYVVAVALVLLCAEWLVYCRRTAT